MMTVPLWSFRWDRLVFMWKLYATTHIKLRYAPVNSIIFQRLNRGWSIWNYISAWGMGICLPLGPIPLNQEFGQRTNLDQSFDNGFFSSEKPRKPLQYMWWKTAKIKRSSHFKVSISEMERILSWKVVNLRWKGPWGNSRGIFLPRVLPCVLVTWVTHYDDDCKVEDPRRHEGRQNPNYLSRLELFRPVIVCSKILALLSETYPFFALMNFQRSLCPV